MKQPTETPEIKTPVQGEAGQAGPSTPKRPLNTSPPKQARREPHAKPAESEDPSPDPKALLSALKESEARLRALVENSTDLIWIYYFDGRAADVSRGYGGYSRDDWAQGGLTFLRSLHSPDSLKRLDKALEYVLTARERATNLRVELRNKDGGHRHYSMNLAPVMTDDQNVIGLQVVVHDITELSMTQQALNASEARFFDIIETAHDLVWSVDREARWTYLNQATRVIYGREPEQMIGQSIADVMDPESRDKDLAALAQVLEGKDLIQYETRHLNSGGELRHLSFNIKPMMDKEWNIVGAMGTARDITEQKRYQHRLEHLAEHDVLTNIYNRHYFERELERVVAQTKRGNGAFGLLYVDLDNFKYVNDTLGHAAGDTLLVELAQILQGRLRQGDTLARFGGDEFTILLHGMTPQTLHTVAQSYHGLFAGYTFFQEERVFDIRVSLGAVMVTAETDSASEVLAQADLACAMAKTRGRNTAHVFDPADRAKAKMVSDVSWSRKINEALKNDGFTLLFQPIVHIKDNQVAYHEVLLRMQGEDGGLIVPGLFLSQAERFGLIHAIDRWVVVHAIERLAVLRETSDHRFAINLSGRAFEDSELLPLIRSTLTRTRLDPASLTFEITETAAISHMASAKDFIRDLRALNCRFALDDFGSGFSSYGYLKSLPADYLKIDGGFIENLAADPLDQALVQSMNQVAHALGKQTIAEFVEDAASLELLRAYGVDYAQGYYLGRPSRELVTTLHLTGKAGDDVMRET
jgi:diguanylate cyclase (GGDEF)-like protein/PAS domain S-box-containing protein